MVYASRTGALQPEGAYEVLARAQALEAEGRSIVHLEIGEPDFATPPNISLAAIDAIASGRTRYNPTAGLPALRDVIARQAGEQRGVSFEANHVVVGPGAKPLLFFPTLALVESGDQVIYPDPGFPTYRAMIEIAGGEPVPVPLSEPDGFSFDLEALDAAISERTRLIIINSPGNPTGATLPQEDLEHIALAAQRVDAWVLSDEIYTRTVFDGAEAPSIASLDGMLQRTIIVDGFSKTYAMTGWRLGFGIMPAPLAARVALLLNHSVGCTAHFTQLAAIEALTGPQDAAHAMVTSYQRRRDLVVAGLSSLPGRHLPHAGWGLLCLPEHPWNRPHQPGICRCHDGGRGRPPSGNSLRQPRGRLRPRFVRQLAAEVSVWDSKEWRRLSAPEALDLRLAQLSLDPASTNPSRMSFACAARPSNKVRLKGHRWTWPCEHAGPQDPAPSNRPEMEMPRLGQRSLTTENQDRLDAVRAQGDIGVQPVPNHAHRPHWDTNLAGKHIEHGSLRLSDDNVGTTSRRGFDEGDHRPNIRHEPFFGRAVEIGMRRKIGKTGADVIAQLPQTRIGQGGIKTQDDPARVILHQGEAVLFEHLCQRRCSGQEDVTAWRLLVKPDCAGLTCREDLIV